jgi:hypothetical protein
VLEGVEVDVKLAFELAFKTAFELALPLPPVGEELLDIVIPNAGNLSYNYIITFRFVYDGSYYAYYSCSACSAQETF